MKLSFLVPLSLRMLSRMPTLQRNQSVLLFIRAIGGHTGRTCVALTLLFASNYSLDDQLSTPFQFDITYHHQNDVQTIGTRVGHCLKVVAEGDRK